MSQFTEAINQLVYSHTKRQEIESKIEELKVQLRDYSKQYAVMLEAQQLLTTVSDDNTTAVLDYITGVINKSLSEIFPHDVRRIYLEKTLHAGKYAHIKVKLENSQGRERHITLQSGTGLRQIISFLFVLSLIEIRKSRRILVMDELLNGLHPDSKRIIVDIMQIFAEEGFQFVMVEYGVNDLGKIYLVEKPSTIATVTHLDKEYEDEVFMFNPPDIDFDRDVLVADGG